MPDSSAARIVHKTTCAINSTGHRGPCTCGAYDPLDARLGRTSSEPVETTKGRPVRSRPLRKKSSVAKSPVAGEPGGAATSPGSTTAASTEPDLMLGEYADWMNEWLFEKKGESDFVIWRGPGRWLVGSYEAPDDLFLVEIHRAEVRRVKR